MFQVITVVFRECLEIAIVLNIILAATRNFPKSMLYIIYGIVIGIVSALSMSFSIKYIATSFDGIGEEVFDIIVMFTAVITIGWTLLLMRCSSIKIKKEINAIVANDSAMTLSSKLLLSLMVTTVIFREIFEIILFVYSIATSSSVSLNDCIFGSFVGLALGFLIGILIYSGILHFASKYVFRICTILMIFVAGGIVSEIIGLLTSIGAITFLTDYAWDSSWIVSDQSYLGIILKIIFGYKSRPSIIQLLCYICTIVIFVALSKLQDIIYRR